MKTVLKNGEYERVPNEVADTLVKSKGYKFVSKGEWKKNVRDISSKIEEPKEGDILPERVEKKKPYQKKKKS